MIIGVSITKRIPNFRGGTEEFSNVYHYDTDPTYTADDLITDIVNIERDRLFNGNVRFVRAKAWGPTDQGIAASEMLVQRDLNFDGAAADGRSTQIYPELAVVVNWATGRKDSRGNPIFLRKYYHPIYIGGSGQAALGDAPISQSFRDVFVNAANALKNLGSVGSGGSRANLCNEMGAGLPLGTDATVLPYLRIRQFRG